MCLCSRGDEKWWLWRTTVSCDWCKWELTYHTLRQISSFHLRPRRIDAQEWACGEECEDQVPPHRGERPSQTQHVLCEHYWRWRPGEEAGWDSSLSWKGTGMACSGFTSDKERHYILWKGKVLLWKPLGWVNKRTRICIMSVYWMLNVGLLCILGQEIRHSPCTFLY